MRQNENIEEITGMLGEMLQDMLGLDARKDIGKLPPELLKMKRDFDRDTESLTVELKYRTKMLELQLRKEFDEKQEELKAKHDELWGKVYKHFNVDPEKKYAIKHGMLQQIILDESEI